MKKYLLLLIILAFLCMPAMADYSPDGFLLRTVEKGEVNGGIYVGGGHGRVYTTSYTQSFIVPSGTVKWARLYVSAKDTPWINVSFNGHLLGNYTNLTSNPKVYANYKEDGSMYWAYYDNASDYIVKGSNTATANLGSISGKSPKSWGIALLAVYEGGDDAELIEYWINEGNPLLHGDQTPFIAHRNTTNTSFEPFEPVETTGITGAALWTGYIWGSEYDEPHDTLFFNSQLIAVNTSDGAGIDDLGNVWRTACFDLEKWNVSSVEENNAVYYDRGGDDILSPVLAVLVLKRGNLRVDAASSAPISSLGNSLSAILNENGRPRHTGDNEAVITAHVTDEGMGIHSVTVDLSAIGGSSAALMSETSPGIYTVNTKAVAGINGSYSFVVTAKDNGGNTATNSTNSLTIYRRGDVVRNNVVDMGDALYIARCTVGLESPDMDFFNFVGDMIPASDSDHKVDMGDALYIARYSVGLEPAP